MNSNNNSHSSSDNKKEECLAQARKAGVEIDRIPTHIAIIMDGNGRWAKKRGLDRSLGHQQGVETVTEITSTAARLGIKYLTLYTFSTENWNRPAEEVSALMSLILTAMEEELFMKNNVQLQLIGQIDRLPEIVRNAILGLQERTSKNTGMTVVLAISYSSKWEITDAVQKIANELKEGSLKAEDITEDTINQHLATNFMPDPDLLIRTGGELRLSNYLLWQCAYSELYFCDTYWPDFNSQELYKAIADYQSRERRYGKTSEQVEAETPATAQ